MMNDAERMLFCDVCGANACFGFDVTLEGLKMGDVGTWRCSEHHPARTPSRTREHWAQTVAACSCSIAPLHEAAE
jgi:hypothetical protein